MPPIRSAKSGGKGGGSGNRGRGGRTGSGERGDMRSTRRQDNPSQPPEAQTPQNLLRPVPYDIQRRPSRRGPSQGNPTAPLEVTRSLPRSRACARPIPSSASLRRPPRSHYSVDTLARRRELLKSACYASLGTVAPASTSQPGQPGPSTSRPPRTGPSTSRPRRPGPSTSIPPRRAPKKDSRLSTLRTINAAPVPQAPPPPQEDASNIPVVQLETSEDEDDTSERENDDVSSSASLDNVDDIDNASSSGEESDASWFMDLDLEKMGVMDEQHANILRESIALDFAQHVKNFSKDNISDAAGDPVASDDNDSSVSDASEVSVGSGIRLNLESDPEEVGEEMMRHLTDMGQSETGPLMSSRDTVAEHEESDSDEDQPAAKRVKQASFKNSEPLRDYPEDDTEKEEAVDSTDR